MRSEDLPDGACRIESAEDSLDTVERIFAGEDLLDGVWRMRDSTDPVVTAGRMSAFADSLDTVWRIGAIADSPGAPCKTSNPSKNRFMSHRLGAEKPRP